MPQPFEQALPPAIGARVDRQVEMDPVGETAPHELATQRREHVVVLVRVRPGGPEKPQRLGAGDAPSPQWRPPGVRRQPGGITVTRSGGTPKPPRRRAPMTGRRAITRA